MQRAGRGEQLDVGFASATRRGRASCAARAGRAAADARPRCRRSGGGRIPSGRPSPGDACASAPGPAPRSRRGARAPCREHQCRLAGASWIADPRRRRHGRARSSSNSAKLILERQRDPLEVAPHQRPQVGGQASRRTPRRPVDEPVLVAHADTSRRRACRCRDRRGSPRRAASRSRASRRAPSRGDAARW